MNAEKISYPQSITKTVTINAPAAKVWEALTNTELMRRWMAEEEITIITDWQTGGQILICGDKHWVYFENKGTVLAFEPEKLLRYNYASSLSRLPDVPESYTLVEFKLEAVGNQTTVLLTASNFPTETIYKHVAFYWNTTLEVLKTSIERQQNFDNG